jgi:hypothetical protein
MTQIVEPGEVRIKSFEIANKALSAKMNPLGQLAGFDIWEDMSKPTLYATFMFEDNVGLLQSFPIIGEEVFTIEFETPGMSSSTKYSFRSFEVANVQKDVNGKGMTYMVRCVSEEHLYSGSSLVKQSFNDTISNIVPVIIAYNLSSKKPIIIDETKGIQTLVIPKLNPLQAIDMCRQRAVSKNFASSSYVFFENQAGFNFKTIEGLIKEGRKTIGSRVFNAQQNVMANKETEAKSFRTILDYVNIAKSDSNKKASEGVYKAVTKTFDLATKTVTTTNFDLQQVFNKFELPTVGKQIPNSTNFIEEFGSGVPKQFFLPKDTMRLDTFIDTMVATRNSFSMLLNSDITRVLIHGDSGLKVGDLITLNLPAATGTTERKKQDELVSGNYLIIRLRHMITAGTKSRHQISFDCVKMGI